MSNEATDEQALLPAPIAVARKAAAQARRTQRASKRPTLAEENPVARVIVDSGLAHLDRPFDYLVPDEMADTARAGVRVKVRFAGKDCDGFVVERTERSDHDGDLATLRRVVSDEVVLTEEVFAAAVAVARRSAGSAFDVLRAAVPPRHARTEKEPTLEVTHLPASDDRDLSSWADHQHAAAFFDRFTAGESPRAAVGLLPGDDWPQMIAQACAVAARAGRGVVACVPDVRDVDRLRAALENQLGPERFCVLTSASGPAARYRAFLAAVRGQVPVVIGTRAASLAPVVDLGLLVMLDDGDDLYCEPRAPYQHARETLLLRAHQRSAAVLLLGHSRSVETQHLVDSGWLRSLEATREVKRKRARIQVVGATDFERERDPLAAQVRIPGAVHQSMREALGTGPVLVQVARQGYSAGLACDACRQRAQCLKCGGPLRSTGADQPPACAHCGSVEDPWSCSECDGTRLRASVVGQRRTAEELGRAFPKMPVVSSGGERIVATVPDRPAIVVATPGAEPVAASGYTGVVLLDTDAFLARPDLRAAEEALRRWSNAAGLLRSGGQVSIVGDPQASSLQALVRWDQAAYATEEIAERTAAHLPPSVRWAILTGSAGALDDAMALVDLPDGAEVVGPAPDPDAAEGQGERVIIRVPRPLGQQLADALGQMQRLRSARKLEPVRTQLDPPTL